mgnify:CR=1 FL=1
MKDFYAQLSKSLHIPKAKLQKKPKTGKAVLAADGTIVLEKKQKAPSTNAMSSSTNDIASADSSSAAAAGVGDLELSSADADTKTTSSVLSAQSAERVKQSLPVMSASEEARLAAEQAEREQHQAALRAAANPATSPT